MVLLESRVYARRWLEKFNTLIEGATTPNALTHIKKAELLPNALDFDYTLRGELHDILGNHKAYFAYPEIVINREEWSDTEWGEFSEFLNYEIKRSEFWVKLKEGGDNVSCESRGKSIL